MVSKYNIFGKGEEVNPKKVTRPPLTATEILEHGVRATCEVCKAKAATDTWRGMNVCEDCGDQ